MIAYPPGPPDEFGPKRLLRMSRDPLGFFTQLRRDHGRFVHYRIGPRRVFFLADPELIQDVLVKQARSFLKDQGLESTKPLLGEGLLTSEGEFHRRQRRLAQPAFHHARIASYGATMVEHGLRAREQWRDGQVLDFVGEMMRLALGIVGKTLRFLQGRSEIGAIFVDDRYGRIAGTLPLGTIRAGNAQRNPDILLSYDYDEEAIVNGVRGTEYAAMLQGNTYRGMHGSFSPNDVHNVLIASGPDFRRGFKDPLPSGNVDVAPTVAHILGLPLPGADGRPLLEAFEGGASLDDYRVSREVLQPDAPATGLTIQLATDPDGKDVDRARTSYTFQLRTKSLSSGSKKYSYFDSAKAVRR